MSDNMIRWEQDADGIVTLTMDDPTSSANTMNELYGTSMRATVDRLEAEVESITGVVITSAKKTFFAGGNLTEIRKATKADAQQVFDNVQEIKRDLRRLEKLPKPVVAAINGAALGGGLEIALAANHRIAADAKGSKIGLPEVSLGLLPGGGGVTRTVRMLGLQGALMGVLLQGTQMNPTKAQQTGLVNEVVGTVDELLPAAKAWIKANPEGGVQPWDVKGHRIPGGSPIDKTLAPNAPAFPANLRKQLKGAPMPAPEAIMAAAFEGTYVDFDTALEIESRYFTKLATGQVSKNMIKAFFFDLQHINGGGSRPEGYDKYTAKKVGVIGAGMMGAAIAYVSAKAGIEVVLKDIDLDAAKRGKAYSEQLEAKALAKGRTTQEKSDALLARITPTIDPQDFAGVDLVIEAAFESVEVKNKVFQEIEDIVEPDAILGSNTSTLPITILAEGVKRQEDFIGIHFFSPVDKMPLVEIIRGAKTSDAVLAKVIDYTLQIKKTPIVVHDSRGFFTSRVIGTFINEALAAIGEGVDPVYLEQAGQQAGYPAAPLQLADELTLTLMQKIRLATETALKAEGKDVPQHGAFAVVDWMVENGRPSKKDGAGFYDYAEGKRTGLSKGFQEHFKSGSTKPDFAELQERMLFIESIETVRCFDEGVMDSVADANIGSIFGIGFPAWTGGVLQYINGYEGRPGTPAEGITGPKAFVAQANALAAKYGEQFTPPASLVAKAEAGETYE
ncbi:enoyl-CoA hydratase/isomerase family protein [Tsukamurella tyrosinosolvens]|uniref:3-hydroxyacyl-CoA dehydrogenase NAD-binding domain-containing protein n=1 Tax=Tsukamurella tyrosinosolvens TaxID=57704 RepID=UPI00079C8347|nr:3-hydroxyacyl-CoA dehydrogenase NAD-binding domain-containing protein [Tsukamurella tyrosinosolvens]AUN38922.1 3-hydroxyacyl-CoA dehydrogenase [Tsukamurella tyrosinosolvens]KXP02164.1 3-hydroxyacyl-CoA dehydrogenase [Tsukamurella tyrosinosolvens]KZL96314.1 3-hydroxyacyl-CoA dehydrogenase [Tsukamurella tyrosinosolvens]MCA4996164.1 enoyl-CoA hydratase/isomerase family protein [Tsukamurella tyrosinosolvens]MEC4614905.1 3-hydroxyacyl-CoA dehydrogenase NAD-binding domain-containing protein [Tsuk